MGVFDKFKNKEKAKTLNTSAPDSRVKSLHERLDKEVLEASLKKLHDGKISKKEQNDYARFLNEMLLRNPTHFIYKGNKNMEENLIRNLALSASTLGNYEKAIKLSVDGLKINPKSAYLLYIKGRSEGDMGVFDAGLADLNKAIRLEPKFADVLIERGVIKQKMHDTSGADKDFANARAIEPDIQLPNQTTPHTLAPKGRGVRIEFVIFPKYPLEQQKPLSYELITRSGLSNYFSNADVTYTQNFKESKWMHIKVFAPNAKFQIKPEDITKFYEEFFKSYVERIITGFDQGGMFKCKLYTVVVLDQLMPPEKPGEFAPHPELKDLYRYFKSKKYFVSDAELAKKS
ncbi:MAG: hypothetical protein KGH60_03785 [Candidatus Micrarchaeota archaeon]|nr:hypothetical protein [Candidatus Micrarchaeota archaeon]